MMFLTEGSVSGVMSLRVYWFEAGSTVSSSLYPPSSKDRLNLQLTWCFVSPMTLCKTRRTYRQDHYAPHVLPQMRFHTVGPQFNIHFSPERIDGMGEMEALDTF